MSMEAPDMVLFPMKDLLNMEDAINAPTFEEVRVIAYKPQIASYLGSIEAAIYFQQLSHWQKYAKRQDGFIYKSAKEIYEETYISEKIQRRCREQLSKIGWIEVEKRMANGHPTYHFKVIAKTFGVLMPTGNRPHDSGPTGERPVPIGQTASSITKNTTKNSIYSEKELEDLEKIWHIWLIQFKINRSKLAQAQTDEEKRQLLEEAKKKYKLTDKRKEKIIARIRDAGPQMIAKAIVNVSKSSWHMGDNPQGKKYIELAEFICRSYEQVENWANQEESDE